ncbi:MAG: T9SS type A sorting domain-containing protein, partial [bacterium]
IIPDSVQFVWSPSSDVDHDQTIYTLKLFFGTKRIYFTTLDTTLYVDLRQLQLPQRTSSISWTVEASDQQAVTGVSNGIGTFVLDVATGVGDKLVGIPTEYFVDQNYPNPFNPSTTIRFGLPASGHAMLRVFNLLGQRVATLVDEQKLAGNYEVQWQAGDVPSGAYFYRIQVTGAAKDGKSAFVETKKMYLIK